DPRAALNPNEVDGHRNRQFAGRVVEARPGNAHLRCPTIRCPLDRTLPLALPFSLARTSAPNECGTCADGIESKIGLVLRAMRPERIKGHLNIVFGQGVETSIIEMVLNCLSCG